MVYQLHFEWDQDRTTRRSCPACAADGPHGHCVTSHTPASPVGAADYFTCQSCGCVFAAPFEYPDYGEDYDFEDYLRFYLEMGAGLEAMTAPLERALSFRPTARSMIDVGSGVPLVADFATREYGLSAVSLDPSNYARRGAERLGLSLSGELLGQGSRYDGSTFDIVYSSEVIEHVEAPREFVQTLVDHLSPDGCLVLTTPNAARLQVQTDPLTNISIVWPGIHHVLFTPDSLQQLLRAAGLLHCEISSATGHLVAIASRTPLTSPESQQPSRLSHYLANPPGHSASMALGHQFRALRQAVAYGRWSEAHEQVKALRARVRDEYDWDIHDVAKLLEVVESQPAPGLFSRLPYFATCLPFYTSMVDFQSATPDFRRAIEGFSAQIAIGESLTGGDPLWWGETAHIHQPACFNLGMAYLIDGQVDQAIAAFEKTIQPAPRQTLASLGRRSADLDVQARLQLATAFNLIGQKQTALNHWTAARQHIDSTPAMGHLAAISEAIERQLI